MQSGISQQTFEVSDLREGIYFLKIKAGDFTQALKFVVKR
jgi:hypothetical protein